MGIAITNVYFLVAPTPVELVTALEALTGLPVSVSLHGAPITSLVNPLATATYAIDLVWREDRQRTGHLVAGATLGHYRLPFPDYPVSVRIEAAASTALHDRYWWVSLLIVLQQLGGRTEQAIMLPEWAGKPWREVQPVSWWKKVKERLKQVF
jgi:hypothetical protein